MAEIRFYSSDPKSRSRSFLLEKTTGRLVAAAILAAGFLVLLGLLGAPALIADLSRSADRLVLREEARRGEEALQSVMGVYDRLSRRVASDELFVARVAYLLDVALPPGVPAPAGTPEGSDLERRVDLLERRVVAFGSLRRLLSAASAAAIDPLKIPSRSPLEPSGTVPIAVFGPRVSPLTKHQDFHTGLTLAAPINAVVIAPAAGTVLYAGPVPSKAGAAWRPLGTILVLAHGERIRTVFGHLEAVLVRPRQRVHRGEPVARVGKSGVVPSPRLEYEVWRLTNGRFRPVDPRIHILDAAWLTAGEFRALPEPPSDADLPPMLR